jgi:hypothetical protein
MADVTVDISQLAALAADLRRHSRETPSKLVPVVSRGALQIKRDWQRAWSGLAHAPALPAAVTYDVKVGARTVEAEIGPDKGRRQGALGNIIEFGTSNNAPIPGGAPALRNEEPKFLTAVEKIAGGILG